MRRNIKTMSDGQLTQIIIQKEGSEIRVSQMALDPTKHEPDLPATIRNSVVFLSEEHIAQIVALKFNLENFTYDDLIDAMKHTEPQEDD